MPAKLIQKEIRQKNKDKSDHSVSIFAKAFEKRELAMGALFHEFQGVAFEPLLAGYTAKMIGVASVGDFEFGCIFVHNGAANWVFGHYFMLTSKKEVVLSLLMIIGKKRRSGELGKDVSFIN